MRAKLSRRDFLKLNLLGLSGLAFQPFKFDLEGYESGEIARVASDSLSVYSMPSDKSRILYQRFRDDLVHVYYEVTSEYGPGYNPIWYRVWGGYIHSAHMVRIRPTLNTPLSVIPEKGQLAEITVPFSQSYRLNKITGWKQVYRLYFGSNHWITGIDEGPDGSPWYRLLDELLEVEYHVPASHMRPIPPEEISPISPDVPPEEKHIDVSLSQQTLTAYEGTKVVLQTKISSGVPSYQKIPGLIPTDTPVGTYHVQSKMPSKHMGGGDLTPDLNYYVLPGVPWTSFFEMQTGVAFHGTYWHTNFGVPMSRGCVNMRTEEAKWIFRWTTPAAPADANQTVGWGTLVRVF
jgi:hypothetical protein